MLCVLKRRVHKIQNFNEEITTLSPLCKHVNCYLTCNCIESVYSMPKFMFQKPTNKSDSVGVFPIYCSKYNKNLSKFICQS